MTAAEVTNFTEHNEHLMMPFAIQPILSIHKESDPATRFISREGVICSCKLIVETMFIYHTV